MNEFSRELSLNISRTLEDALIAGARSTEPVRGLTHGFYKYPARFSPTFVRSAINAFTNRGDLVLDPHVGGGTTLVEALALGRDAIGVDISALAEFVSRVKSTVFSDAELDQLASWAELVPDCIDIHKPSTELSEYAELGYYKHLKHPSRWRLRKAIEQAMASAICLATPRLESFGRCAVLRAAQWALDGRSKQPTFGEFRAFLKTATLDMVKGARALRTAVMSNGPRPIIEVIKRSAAGLEDDARMEDWRSPRLVITSPPYPGVHVLYHRWQVDGRKESPLPFMIANRLDGAGSSYYTMGDRKYPGLRTYFERVQATMSSVAELADHNTVIVQMLAFSEPKWQLPRYLETMQAAGLTESFLPTLKEQDDGRLWRDVPGRRWYSDQRGDTPSSQEVVLIHRKVDGPQSRRAVDAVTSLPRPSV